MPANKYTLKAVDAILEADLGVSSIIRGSVQKLLGSEPQLSCTEIEAARLLEISNATLFNWRKGKWERAPHDFIFRVWYNPAGEVRYDLPQLQAYVALRKCRSNRENPQPVITSEEIKAFQEITAGRM